MRFDRLSEVGCICCRRHGYKVAPEIHHLVEGMRRLGDDYTIPLCAYHHRGVGMSLSAIENIFGPSRHHDGRRAFEKHWGTEKELLAEVNDLIGVSDVYCVAGDCMEPVKEADDLCAECYACVAEAHYDAFTGH